MIELLRLRIHVGQDSGSLTSGIDPTLAAQMLVALAVGIQVQWLLDPEDTQMLKVFDAFCHVLLGVPSHRDGSQLPALANS